MRHEFDVNHLLQIMDRCREYEPGHRRRAGRSGACAERERLAGVGRHPRERLRLLRVGDAREVAGLDQRVEEPPANAA